MKRQKFHHHPSCKSMLPKVILLLCIVNAQVNALMKKVESKAIGPPRNASKTSLRTRTTTKATEVPSVAGDLDPDIESNPRIEPDDPDDNELKEEEGMTAKPSTVINLRDENEENDSPFPPDVVASLKEEGMFVSRKEQIPNPQASLPAEPIPIEFVDEDFDVEDQDIVQIEENKLGLLEELPFKLSSFKSPCCRPRIPKCCVRGTGMLWDVGVRDLYELVGAVAQQPSTYNPQCLNSIDFDTLPSPLGQPFCHEIMLTNPSLTSSIVSAALHLIIYSDPPCASRGIQQDQLCLSTYSSTGESGGGEWCTMLDPGKNEFCLHLEDFNELWNGSFDKLLVRVAYHSSVDYLRLHTIMCENAVPTPGVTYSASLHFDFTNTLDATVPNPPSVPPFVYSPGTESYMSGGPRGTSVVFPPLAGSTSGTKLVQPNIPEQQGGGAMSMAVWVYYDRPGVPWLIGLPLVSKHGSYRWMVNPGHRWDRQHVHLGGGSGNLVYARGPASDPDFRVPVQKWLCLAVTIEANPIARQTTLHYYLNGALVGSPTVTGTVYKMDGTADLVINTDALYAWSGKLDSFSLWQYALSPEQVNNYCNCAT